MLDDGSNYDLEDKTVSIKTGVKIDDDVEYQELDSYIIPKPDTEEVSSNTSLTGYDYMLKFDVPYVDNVTYPIRADDYLEALCNQVGVILGSKDFLNNDYMILGNPFTNGETCRTVLSNVVQLALGFAVIEEEKLYVRSLDVNGEVVETIDGNNYEEFSPNNIFGPVNSFKIQMNSDVDGEESVRELSGLTDETRCQISISDNYFLTSEAQRELVIDKMFNAIKGLSYLPVKISYYGYPWLKLGDKIKVKDKNDNEYTTYVMNHTFTYNGGYSGVIESIALTKTQSTYQNTNDLKTRFRRTELAVDKINGEITSVIEKVDDQNSKISQITQTVEKLSSSISDIADITVSKESTNAKVSFETINQSEPIRVEIHPLLENISYLYPRDNLFPSNNLFLKDRTLRFKNTTTSEIFDYTLPCNLLYYDAEHYDEFILDYGGESCIVNKRVGYNADGTTYILEEEVINTYTFPHIELTDGDYEVTLLGYSTGYLFVRLMAQNIYTTQFATRVELNSEITQTKEEINLSVNEKLTNYSTTTEMNSAISLKADSILSSVNKKFESYDTSSVVSSKIEQKADSITSTVSNTYATKTELTTAKTEIKQTTDSITSTVSTKVGSSEIISKINQSSESVTISASKINLSGYLTISSASSTYATISGLSSGTTTISGGCITTGTIDASKVTVKNLNASNITSGTIKSTNYVSGSAGTSINLSTGAIDTAKFKVSSSGNITATGGTIGGWTINSEELTNGDIFINNNGYSNVYTVADFFIIKAYLLGESWATMSSSSRVFEHLDINGDGEINSGDLFALQKKLLLID